MSRRSCFARGGRKRYATYGMVDFAEWIAIGLGVLAVAIAVWDDVRDRYYCWAGPVKANLVKFDIPQPNVHIADDENGIHLRMSWTCLNRVSWAVLVGFTFVYEVEDGSSIVKMTLTDEHYGNLKSTRVYLPPRQPVELTLWVVWPLDKSGEVTPSVEVFSGRHQALRGPCRKLAWPEGRPCLCG